MTAFRKLKKKKKAKGDLDSHEEAEMQSVWNRLNSVVMWSGPGCTELHLKSQNQRMIEVAVDFWRSSGSSPLFQAEPHRSGCPGPCSDGF